MFFLVMFNSPKISLRGRGGGGIFGSTDNFELLEPYNM